jgi:hypothetical protein
MAIEILNQILIDHHTHTLRSDFLQVDRLAFRQAFSESRSLTQIRDHVPWSLSYMDFIDKLGELLDVKGEEKILHLREEMRADEYVNLLLDDVSVGAMIVDEGYIFKESMNAEHLSALAQRPIFVCRRIETALEESLTRATNFSELEEVFPKVLLKKGACKIVGLKTIAAYRGGLDLEIVSRSKAMKDFDATKRDTTSGSKPRIGRSDLYHYFLLQTFELAADQGLPVQVHAGIGDSDEDLRTSNPLCFRGLLEAKRFANCTFVFLHAYPFVKEISYLASIYKNVYLDLSLVTFLGVPALKSCFVDALSLAPASKVLVSTDGHSIPETHWYGALSLKRALTNALDSLIEERILTGANAELVAARMLHENARELYELEGLC